MADDSGASKEARGGDKPAERRPLLFGQNPRINLSRLGIGGWLVLLALVIVAGWFWRYTLGALYTGMATLSYWAFWGLDRAFLVPRLSQRPWLGWVLCGIVLGGTLGFISIAKIYGLRRARWAILALVIAVIAGVAFIPASAVRPTSSTTVRDALGPVVRTKGAVETSRGKLIRIRYIVRDQSAKAEVTIVIISRKNDLRVTEHRAGKVSTGRWHVERFECRLQPGRYQYVVRAVDEHGNSAVHEGVGSLKVRK